MLRRILTLAVGAVVFGGVLLVVASPVQAGNIRPFLNCVRPLPDDPAGNTAEGVFGYASSLATSVTIPISADKNFFTPGQANQGQPTVFHPGVHDNVVVARWQFSGIIPQIAWVIDAGGLEAAFASGDSRKFCDAPRDRGGWDPTKPYITNDLVSFNGSLWVLAEFGFTHNSPAIGSQPGPPGMWHLWDGRRLGLSTPPPTVFPSGQVLTFPRNGVLTITDPSVNPNSVLLVQYVGDRRSGEPRIVTVGNGQFTVRGASLRQFRYVVID